MLAPPKELSSNRKSSYRNGKRVGAVIFGIAAVAGAICIMFFVLSGNEEFEEKQSDSKSSLIAEVKPDSVKSANVTKEERIEPEKPKKRTPPEDVKPDDHGVLRWPGGARYVEEYFYHDDGIDPYAGEKRIFKHGSDSHIASLMMLEPGQMILGGFRYDRFFDKAFLESLEDNIEFSDDDTPQERREKEEVIAAREILKDALDKGESPAKVMQETRDELVKLFRYKQDLTEQIAVMKNEGNLSDNDLLDLYEAANEMLREKGISEFSTKMLKRRIGQWAEEEMK